MLETIGLIALLVFLVIALLAVVVAFVYWIGHTGIIGYIFFNHMWMEMIGGLLQLIGQVLAALLSSRD